MNMVFGRTDYKNFDKMEPSIRMRIIYSVRYRYAVHFKFGDKFLTSLTKLVFEAKGSISSTIKKSSFILFKVFSICCRCHNLTYF